LLPTNQQQPSTDNNNINYPEPITTILGIPEGEETGEIFINMGSTINLTCIVKNLPELSTSIFWAHNNQVSGLPLLSACHPLPWQFPFLCKYVLV